MGPSLKCLPLFFMILLLETDCESLETSKGISSYPLICSSTAPQLLMNTIADSREIPRDIEWGPAGFLWYTEQKRTVGRIAIQGGLFVYLLTHAPGHPPGLSFELVCRQV